MSWPGELDASIRPRGDDVVDYFLTRLKFHLIECTQTAIPTYLMDIILEYANLLAKCHLRNGDHTVYPLLWDFYGDQCVTRVVGPAILLHDFGAWAIDANEVRLHLGLVAHPVIIPSQHRSDDGLHNPERTSRQSVEMPLQFSFGADRATVRESSTTWRTQTGVKGIPIPIPNAPPHHCTHPYYRRSCGIQTVRGFESTVGSHVYYCPNRKRMSPSKGRYETSLVWFEPWLRSEAPWSRYAKDVLEWHVHRQISMCVTKVTSDFCRIADLLFQQQQQQPRLPVPVADDAARDWNCLQLMARGRAFPIRVRSPECFIPYGVHRHTA